MVNQYIWIGVTIGAFFAGIGIGYGVLQSNPTMMMNPQQMQQMMNNPQAMNQMILALLLLHN